MDEDQVVEEKPIENQIIEEKPIENEVVEEKPIEEQVIEEPQIEEIPTETNEEKQEPPVEVIINLKSIKSLRIFRCQIKKMTKNQFKFHFA